LYVFGDSLLRQNESDLGKLSGKLEAVRVTECISLSADVDIAKEGDVYIPTIQ